MSAVFIAETEGFEPSCRLPDNLISSQARYDHFDTSPSHAFHYSTDLEEKGSTNLRKKAGANKHRLEEG